MREQKFWCFLSLSCAVFCFVRSNPVDLKDVKKPFSIEEAALGQMAVMIYPGKWISDTEIEYLDKTTKDVKVFNVAKNQKEVVLKSSVLNKYKTTKYHFSPDRKFVLITYDEKAVSVNGAGFSFVFPGDGVVQEADAVEPPICLLQVYRHSKRAKYVVYSIKDGNYYNVDKDHLQIAEWGPKGNTLVYIKNNDIYLILNINAKMEKYRITKDGKSKSVLNGLADWVYEEEILSSGKAFWFSPEGDQLAFIRFYDATVKKVSVPEYGEPGDLKHQYVGKVDIPYPKAGSSNPTYEVRHVYFDKKQEIRTLAKSVAGLEVLHELEWISNDAVMYLQTNRVQNESKFYVHEVKPNGTPRLFFEEKNSKGWANTNFPIISKKLDRSLRIDGVPVGKSGKFKHLVLSYTNGTSYPLTGGLFEVVSVLHWDETKKIIYYSATQENAATGNQVFAVKEGKGSKPVCLTCKIKSPEGRICKDASASFSTMSNYIILSCNGPDPKVVYLYKNAQPLGKPMAVLEDNAKLRGELKKKLLPEVMNLSVEVQGPFKADVRLLLPPNLDRSGKTKYPLLIYVYGGPASKNIKDAFKLDWGLYMSTNLKVIYGLIDGRNTLRKGENMLFAGYRALGTLEMKDQINVTRSLQKMFPFVDPSRTGIWGWSYGGYATTKILETDVQGVFKCGVAVAPVADWIYYDSMYTERYLGLPKENKKGYDNASTLKDVSNLRNKKYLLIHGNADDNVHYQNAMMIAKLLQRNNIPFEMMSYPDEDHSLIDVRKHLYYTMTNFWKRCFNLPN